MRAGRITDDSLYAIVFVIRRAFPSRILATTEMMKIKRNTTDLYGIIFVVCGNRVNSFVSTYTHCVFSSMEEKNKSTKWDVWLLSCELLLLYLPSSSTVPTYQFNFIIHIFNINGWMVCDAHCEIGMLLIQFIYILIIEKKNFCSHWKQIYWNVLFSVFQNDPIVVVVVDCKYEDTKILMPSAIW